MNLRKTSNNQINLGNAKDNKDLFKVNSIDSNGDHDLSNNGSSPSELTYSLSNDDPINITKSNYSLLRKTSSSPIQSNLPSIFSNLRSNDNLNDSIPPIKYGKNIIKRLLHIDEDGKKKSIERSLNLNHSTSDLQFLDNQIKLDTDFAKIIGQIDIDPVFNNEGLYLTKISHKSKKRILIFIDSINFKFKWKVASVLPLNNTRSNSNSSIDGYKSLISSSRIHEFTLDDIKSIYMQDQGSSYREELNVPKEYENQWITIIYLNQKKGNLKSLHLICESIEDFEKLSSAIINLRNLRYQLAKEFLINLNDLKENHVKSIILDKEPSDSKIVRDFLSFQDILKYAKRLNINVNKNYLQSIFDQVLAVNPTYDEQLNFDQFKKFVSILKNRQDIAEIWESLKNTDKEGMTLDDVTLFIKDTQKEQIENEDVIFLFDKFKTPDNLWSADSLNNFLLSSYSKSVHNIETKQYYNYPLTDYYISSSHNTYLIGRQVAGDSSVDGYIKALQKGCRCIEIDIWNGDNSEEINNSEPNVNHGRTFSKSISFANVINTIKKFAFITTPYPLILSLEVHCTPQNQIKVVNTLKDILKDKMIIAPINDDSSLPSPSQLKNKFIIKVKKTSAFQNLIEMDDGSFTTTTTTSMSEDNETKPNGNFFKRKVNKNPKIINELSDLGVYVQGLKFRNFSLPESKTFNHCFSLSEKTINKIIKDEDKNASLNKHNKKYFVRVYPSKTRIKSTNFNPIQYWIHGVQMVATNWQTYDLGQQLNEAMFEGVDKKGYVLKSKELRKPYLKSSKFNFLTTATKSIKFELTIISGHQLPKYNKDDENAINPFITFEIIGAESINWDKLVKSNIFKTKIIPENGFNPIWDESIGGKINVNSDLIFIKFQIFNSLSKFEEVNSQPIGVIVHKLNYLRQGYRYLSINDLFGENLVYSSLLIKLNYDDEVMSNL
ncbi:unnamed protein product [Candida verbasci]|uniref:Phosphoinositide phospholipase C n=1 Tax=Candida verbasci TaxID=1227364 RepID=A0A9W4U177_9ASCO|nr:unnamed protein product [Candida verbasci]